MRRLEQMANKGLIFRIEPEGGPAQFQALQYVVGICEFHVNDLDTELVRDMGEYLPILSKEAWKLPQLRTVPVGRSITARMEILPHEKAEELVRGQKSLQWRLAFAGVSRR